MLRASASVFEYDLDVRGLTDPTIDTGVQGGFELIALVDSVLGTSNDNPDNASEAVVDALDEASLLDAASVFGNFEMMNRVAEASGIPIPKQAIERHQGTIDELNVGHFNKS
ncbi:MAG: hypothetical protein ACR2N2_13035 [Acidimicrobiia bacterium]